VTATDHETDCLAGLDGELVAVTDDVHIALVVFASTMIWITLRDVATMCSVPRYSSTIIRLVAPSRVITHGD
jgi:hypothetical protein